MKSLKEPLEGFMGKRQPVAYDHYGTGLMLPPAETERLIEIRPGKTREGSDIPETLVV